MQIHFRFQSKFGCSCICVPNTFNNETTISVYLDLEDWYVKRIIMQTSNVKCNAFLKMLDLDILTPIICIIAVMYNCGKKDCHHANAKKCHLLRNYLIVLLIRFFFLFRAADQRKWNALIVMIYVFTLFDIDEN